MFLLTFAFHWEQISQTYSAVYWHYSNETLPQRNTNAYVLKRRLKAVVEWKNSSKKGFGHKSDDVIVRTENMFVN